MTTPLFPKLAHYLADAANDFEQISLQRKALLRQIADGVIDALDKTGHAALIYVCTHNSRRSHMGQLWAAAAAAYYNIPGVATYSGGTAITAFNPNAIQALADAGFKITGPEVSPNPHYSVAYSAEEAPVEAFSKRYMDPPNPADHFIAVMTCAHADDNCPFVAGASLRVATPYEDPKEADGKPNQAQVYSQRCKEIATEVLYTFSLVAEKVANG
ncbi:low molecular weight phosphatase family protein [Chitinophaga parva]|nr:protein-tyrosine-phosphatase [Chitinophaga parva]